MLVVQCYYHAGADLVRERIHTGEVRSIEITDGPPPKTWRETTGRGDTAEFAVLLALTSEGRKVLRPMSSAMRYDLLVDNEDGTFTRIQCKSGTLRSGRIEFRLYSVSGHNTRKNGYRGQIDAFGVYCPETGATYLVPMKALGDCGTLAALRTAPARNGQLRRTRSAEAFKIGSRTEPKLIGP